MGEDEPQDYLVIQEGGGKFGIRLQDVREVLRVPDGARGGSTIRYQGGEIDVVDFTGLAEGGQEVEDAPRLVVLRTDPPTALLIPQVVGIRALREMEISSTARFPVGGPVGGSLTGVVRVGGEMIFLLDAFRLIASSREARSS